MTNIRLSIAVCAAAAEVLHGSHATLDALFESAGAPGPPPELAHHSKWKEWLRRVGSDPDVDSLAVLGFVIEEFMDLPPSQSNSMAAALLGSEDDPEAEYRCRRDRLASVLEKNGLRYFRGGRVLPIAIASEHAMPDQHTSVASVLIKPSSVDELLETLVRGLPRAMHPLVHRRRGATALSFASEYDIQDLLHSLLRPWVADIRPEESTPSYAGSSTRMDFLLPAHELVVEVKRVRDKSHSRRVGDELIIDIDHYRKHPDCQRLWCVVYDPGLLIPNPRGLIADLEGTRTTSEGTLSVRLFILGS